LENLQRLRVGPVGPHIESFAALISQQGYSDPVGWLKLRLAARLSRWLHHRQISLSQLNESRINAFLSARWKGVTSRAHVGHRATMALLLQHLREANFVPAPPQAASGSDIDLLVSEYERFLVEERGFMLSSTKRYVGLAHRFLSQRFPTRKIYLKRLRTQDVTAFVLHDTSIHGRRAVQFAAASLRCFLNFLFQKGRITTNLAGAVPAVPHPRLAELPRYLEGREIERVLGSCDRRRKIGKRDYAILLLLARLGLRAGEVVQLTLDDLDWRAGELLVRGKGARVDRLPLLKDVGQALADYLQKARPACSSRRIFITCKAPLQGLAGAGCVSNIVRAALLRVGLCPRNRGAHILRHSLATGMLRNGASLAQIGQVLRHQLPQTTEIYAKVDFRALRFLALPWPGGAA
jgi:site-specific recombinase XerD